MLESLSHQLVPGENVPDGAIGPKAMFPIASGGPFIPGDDLIGGKDAEMDELAGFSAFSACSVGFVPGFGDRGSTVCDDGGISVRV